MGLNVTLTAEDIPHAGAFAPFLKLPLCRALLPTRRFRLVPKGGLPERGPHVGIGEPRCNVRWAPLAHVRNHTVQPAQQRIHLALHVYLSGCGLWDGHAPARAWMARHAAYVPVSLRQGPLLSNLGDIMPTIDFSKIGEPIDAVTLREIFDEIGLALGGLVAVHLLPLDPKTDEFLWRLCQNLDVIRGRALRRLNPRACGLPARPPSLKAHPAIFEFLHPRVTFEEP